MLVHGLGTRLAAVPRAFTMIVVLFVVHDSEPWQQKELAALYLTVYAVIIIAGAGRFSLDQFI